LLTQLSEARLADGRIAAQHFGKLANGGEPLTFGLDQLLVIGGSHVDKVYSIVPGFGHGPPPLLEAKIACQPKPWEDRHQQEHEEAHLKT
jgi:hypothetical protein